MISSSAVKVHVERQGRDPMSTLESGVGLYVPADYDDAGC
jgi:hypothetical protein